LLAGVGVESVPPTSLRNEVPHDRGPLGKIAGKENKPSVLDLEDLLGTWTSSSAANLLLLENGSGSGNEKRDRHLKWTGKVW